MEREHEAERNRKVLKLEVLPQANPTLKLTEYTLNSDESSDTERDRMTDGESSSATSSDSSTDGALCATLMEDGFNVTTVTLGFTVSVLVFLIDDLDTDTLNWKYPKCVL